jgi:hypothetical protein
VKAPVMLSTAHRMHYQKLGTAVAKVGALFASVIE